MKTDKPNDPIVTLQRVAKFAERAAVALSVVLLVSTVGYLSIHAWA